MRALFFMGRMARVPGFEKTGGIFPISAKEEIGLGGWTQDGEQQQAIPSLPPLSVARPIDQSPLRPGLNHPGGQSCLQSIHAKCFSPGFQTQLLRVNARQT